jgi:hypothetical protein
MVGAEVSIDEIGVISSELMRLWIIPGANLTFHDIEYFLQKLKRIVLSQFVGVFYRNKD